MNHLQLKASDPEISTWVLASAGTGKTKILTDRVLRLLLSGVRQQKILCLTFTNAAASEMEERITSSLALWHKLTKSGLEQNLRLLLGYQPKAEQIKFAINLYDNFLASEEKLNIQTIHSFCQKLLKKFPFEASVSPNFQILDDAGSNLIIQQIKIELLASEEFYELSNYLCQNFHEIVIDEIFTEIIANKIGFSNKSQPEHVVENWQNLKNQYQIILDLPLIKYLVDANADIADLKSFFLTAEGQKRKRIVNQKIARPGSSLYNELEELQHQVYLLDGQERAYELFHHSSIISQLGTSIIARYEQYKTLKNLLDYDDLIIKTRELLRTSSAKDWVLYKLDGGIDHLLVDEAQDTSPEQWQIIAALIEEFYAGISSKITNRTIFVVGDEKQSIFSFQGADIASFHKMNQLFKSRISNAGKSWDMVNLDISYRSAKEILEVVYQVFQQIKVNNPLLFTANLIPVMPFRDQHIGKVELWPLISDDKSEESFWRVIDQDTGSLTGKAKLAGKIAKYISEQISNKVVLPSTGNPAKPGDFMILVRRRDDFALELIKQLKLWGLAAAGLDRMILSDNLAVLDLISAAKFVLNPEDNLNLACLLKSPIIGMKQEQLERLCLSRRPKSLSLWQHLVNCCTFDSHAELDSASNAHSHPEFISGSNAINSEILKQVQDDTSEVQNDLLESYNKLLFLQRIAKTLNAGNFFHYLVDVLYLREKLVTEGGEGSNDAINELLYYSYNYATNTDYCLQSFIFWFEQFQVEIKREVQASGRISIMTVHGSKGLQAPCVILGDTTTIPSFTNRFLWDEEDKLLSARASSRVPEFYQRLKDQEQQKITQEYLRLLYVAMTRAEDQLIICGYRNYNKLPENCWYEVIHKVMRAIASPDQDGKLVYGSDDNTPAFKAPPKVGDHKFLQIPLEIPKANNFSNNWKISEKEPLRSNIINASSPLSSGDAIEYGIVFHKILQDGIKRGNISDLKSHPLIRVLNDNTRIRINDSIDKLAFNSEFINLIDGSEIKTEVNLGTNINGEIKIGRIDLLILKDNQITIIDYKSDKNPPNINELPPQTYIDQLNFYRQVIQEKYPTCQVLCKILWLENGEFREM